MKFKSMKKVFSPSVLVTAGAGATLIALQAMKWVGGALMLHYGPNII